MKLVTNIGRAIILWGTGMVARVDVMAGKALAAFQSLLGDRSAWSLQRVWLDVQIRHPASDLASKVLPMQSDGIGTVAGVSAEAAGPLAPS